VAVSESARDGVVREAVVTATATTTPPGAYSVGNSSPPDSAVAWSPTITKPQRAGLLRRSEPASDAGRYSVTGTSVEYVEPTNTVAVTDDQVLQDDDDSSARARRFTPKQRPGYRRSRKPEGARVSAPTPRAGSVGNVARDERSDMVRTMPDLQSVRDTQPERQSRAAASTATTLKVPTASAPPLQPPSRPAPPPVEPTASIVVDPELTAMPHYEEVRNRTPPAPAPTPYEPLPSDRAGFEAFMRQRTAELNARGAGLHWNEQETLLIPREALASGPPRRLVHNVFAPINIGLFIVILMAGFGSIALWRVPGSSGGVRTVPLDTTSSAALEGGKSAATTAATTLISTEPSGAELVLGTAVLGNTPLEVARPKQGDDTYVLRLQGFDPQLVRLTPHSGTTISIMLQPTSAPLHKP
jgi:hypothetical protein